MSMETWLAFCVTEAVLCFTPGPAVLLVASVALARGAGSGIGAGLGVLAANTLYFVLSALGIGAAIVASHALFTAIQWAGAAYLVCLGLRMIWAGAKGGDGPVSPRSLAHGFRRGFVVQSANPKTLIFFTALLPQFLDPAGGIGLQVAVLGVSSVAIELFALAVYALAASRARVLAAGSWAGTLERLGGGFLVAAGLRLASVAPSPSD